MPTVQFLSLSTVLVEADSELVVGSGPGRRSPVQAVGGAARLAGLLVVQCHGVHHRHLATGTPHPFPHPEVPQGGTTAS